MEATYEVKQGHIVIDTDLTLDEIMSLCKVTVNGNECYVEISL